MLRTKKIIATLLACIMTVVAPISIYAGELFVSPVRQAMSNWCWAACDQMAGDYEIQGSARTQYDVAQYVLGSQVNLGANIAQIAQGAEYVTYFYADYYGEVVTFSLSTLASYINNVGNPVIPVVVWFDEYGDPVAAHALLVCGHNTSNQLKVIDPYTGTAEWMSYSNLCNWGNGYYLMTAYTGY